MNFKLLNKEFRLAAHPNLYIFSLMGPLLLVPAYPYTILFLFSCIGNYVNLMYSRETNDIYFTEMLPIKRSDVVKAKWQVLLISQAFMILFSIPFALIHGQVFKTNNVAGIDANVAYYGFGLMILGIFNVFFLTEFFKTAYKAGIAFLMGIIPASLIAIAVEVLVHFPNFAWLDSISGSDQLKQLPILVIGIIFYALMMWVAYKVSIKRFAKVNL